MGQPSLLCGCVGRPPWGDCYLLASGGSPGAHSISSHLTPFLCGTRALPAAALVVNPRVGGFASILRGCWPFKWWKSGSFFHRLSPCRFLQLEVMGICLPCAVIVGCVVWPCAGIGCSQRYPSYLFAATSTNAATFLCHAAFPPVSGTLPLLPVWMSVSSLSPWWLDFHTDWFLTVLAVN